MMHQIAWRSRHGMLTIMRYISHGAHSSNTTAFCSVNDGRKQRSFFGTLAYIFRIIMKLSEQLGRDVQRCVINIINIIYRGR